MTSPPRRLPIPNFPGYFVEDTGIIYKDEKPLRPFINAKAAYVNVKHPDGRPTQIIVKRTVMEAFGETSRKRIVHVDGDIWNCAFLNLQYREPNFVPRLPFYLQAQIKTTVTGHYHLIYSLSPGHKFDFARFETFEEVLDLLKSNFPDKPKKIE